MIVKINNKAKFFLTFFEKIEKEDECFNFGDVMCKGFFDNYKDAINTLDKITKNNLVDNYKYAVIELFEEGFSPLCTSTTREVFKFNKDSHIFEPISETEDMKIYMNFAIN